MHKALNSTRESAVYETESLQSDRKGPCRLEGENPLECSVAEKERNQLKKKSIKGQMLVRDGRYCMEVIFVILVRVAFIECWGRNQPET